MDTLEAKATALKILLPTDFTDCAKNARNYALCLLRGEGSITLINLFESSGKSHEEYAAESTAHENLLIEEQNTCCDIRSGDEPIHKVLMNGKIDYLPENVLKENDINLVVMGTEGVEGTKEYYDTSHTAFLLGRLDHNFLVIPKGSGFAEPKRILFATDLATSKDSLDLSVLEILAKRYNSIIHLGIVIETGQEFSADQERRKDELMDLFGASQFQFHVIHEDDIITGIEKLAATENADMVAAVGKHHSFIDRLTHYSITRRLTENTELPLLILKSH